MASEKDKVLGHGVEADGIEEYDNQLPLWWLGLFAFTVVFGVIYGVDYHFVSERSSAKEHQAAIDARPKADATQVAAASVGSAPVDGKSVYDANCIACHGPDLKGGVGPDLTDATWIHGGTVDAINATITNGVPEKGMLTWGPILGPQKIAAVAKFVHEAGGGQ
jgi:cytochrome c oxidase cbb3-type subunit 3